MRIRHQNRLTARAWEKAGPENARDLNDMGVRKANNANWCYTDLVPNIFLATITFAAFRFPTDTAD